MSELVVIAFPTEAKPEEVRQKLLTNTGSLRCHTYAIHEA